MTVSSSIVLLCELSDGAIVFPMIGGIYYYALSDRCCISERVVFGDGELSYVKSTSFCVLSSTIIKF